jgi:NADH:ubiquinone oxidoreductase subunit
MGSLLVQFFTWWNGQTWGTRFWTWRAGEFVGDDEFGNRYYRQKNGARRWVIYNGEAEATRIPPGWYGWMHKMTDVPPTLDQYHAHPWEKPHRPNLTGTPAAYRPRGSILTPEQRPEVTGDYDAWTP